MIILNGKKISDEIKDELKKEVSLLKNKPKLVVIQVGDNEASNVYVRNKIKSCNYIGIRSDTIKFNDDISEESLIELINKLNNISDITGILVQLPLPNHIDSNKVLSYINPLKDVDGFHANNIGNLVLGNDGLKPCTPYGIMKILEYYDIDVSGKECVVVGRSNIVGKPISAMLLNKNGTVTTCHSKTKNLKEICKCADILVCAIGQPRFFNHEYIKDGAVVIDVGIHRLENGKLCGDVDFEDVKDIVFGVTPVPNGVGTTTVAMLMNNCVEAMKLQAQKND